MNKKNWISCIKGIRRIIALLITVVFCYLSIKGDIKADQFIPVFSMIIGYYFGKATAFESTNFTKGSEDHINKNDNVLK